MAFTQQRASVGKQTLSPTKNLLLFYLNHPTTSIPTNTCTLSFHHSYCPIIHTVYQALAKATSVFFHLTSLLLREDVTIPNDHCISVSQWKCFWQSTLCLLLVCPLFSVDLFTPREVDTGGLGYRMVQAYQKSLKLRSPITS